MLTHVFEQDIVCSIDISVNPQTTVVTAIDFGTTSLLTITTPTTGLAGVLLITDDDLAIRLVMTLGQQVLLEAVVGP